MCRTTTGRWDEGVVAVACRVTGRLGEEAVGAIVAAGGLLGARGTFPEPRGVARSPSSPGGSTLSLVRRVLEETTSGSGRRRWRVRVCAGRGAVTPATDGGSADRPADAEAPLSVPLFVPADAEASPSIPLFVTAAARRFLFLLLRKGRRINQSNYWGLGLASPDVRLMTCSYRKGGTSGITMVMLYFLVFRKM